MVLAFVFMVLVLVPRYFSSPCIVIVGFPMAFTSFLFNIFKGVVYTICPPMAVSM